MAITIARNTCARASTHRLANHNSDHLLDPCRPRRGTDKSASKHRQVLLEQGRLFLDDEFARLTIPDVAARLSNANIAAGEIRPSGQRRPRKTTYLRHVHTVPKQRAPLPRSKTELHRKRKAYTMRAWQLRKSEQPILLWRLEGRY